MKSTVAAALAAAALLSGCMSMTPATYIVSPDIKQALAPLQGSKAALVSMEGPAGFNPMCRAVGNLAFENGLTVAQFVQKAFNDELRYAGVFGEGGAQLKGTLLRAEFSSTASLVNGYWDLALRLESANGQSMTVEARHEFESGFNGITACNNTSQALAQAAQMLVRKAVSDPQFARMVR